jgi:hypothetical protein
MLDPATNYKWVVKDKFRNEYSGESTSNGQGFNSIAIADLPERLLSSYAGTFELSIYDPANECKPIDFKMAKYYDSILFDIKRGTNVKANLGCDFECHAAGTGNSAVFPFADVASLNIPWTSLLTTLYGNAPQVQCFIETSPGVYELTTISVTENMSGYILTSIDADFGGTATGYLLIG